MTISEPFGLVPEEFYEKKSEWHNWENDWYDCPGLFEWWCNKYDQPYSKEYVDKTIECLAKYVSRFLLKVESKKCYSRMIAFVRTYTSQLEIRKDHTHRRIIEKAAQIAHVNVEILPDKDLVLEIVENSGRMAWDMYGVAHPMAQEYLLKYLKGVLNEKWYTKLKHLFYGLPS
jgi:archaeosine synthase